ncbi:MAG: PaaI family thioesterase [Hyphomonas sp.]
MTDKKLQRPEQVNGFIDRTPFAQLMGMKCEIKGDEMTAVLPYQDKLIGNAMIRALHGGAMGAFLEITAKAQLYLVTDLKAPPRTINITIDYLRQGRAQDLYARAFITKLGRRMASVRAEAWQESRDKPVTALMAHFLVTDE